MKMYQTTLLSGLFLLGGYAVSAQEINAAQVPASIIKAFEAKYPGATDVEWEKQGTQYKTSFDMGDTDHEAFYSTSGKLVSHSHDINDAELPAAVQASVKTNFPNHKIDDPERIETNGVVTYKVELDGKPDMKAIFSSSGKVLSKMKDD